MRISKSRQKLRPAQPRVEHFRDTPECAGPDEAVDPPTVVRLQGYRRFPPAARKRALVANCPAGPVPHLRAGQAAPRRHLIPPPLRPERPDHIQAYDFVQMRLHDGIDAGLLTVICERTRERQAIRAGRRVRSPDVLEVPGGRAVVRGVAEHLRPGNGPESAARVAREWSGVVGVQDTVHRARVNVGKRLHPELQREAEGRVEEGVFHTLQEVRTPIEQHRRTCDRIGHYGLPGCRTPAAEILRPAGPLSVGGTKTMGLNSRRSRCEVSGRSLFWKGGDDGKR